MFKLVDLNEEELSLIEEGLNKYDEPYLKYHLDGNVAIGYKDDEGNIIAGLDACMTAQRILYVSTIYVAEGYRKKGLGSKLMKELEIRAKELGATLIRLDSFSWQGVGFYEKLGYQCVGKYEDAIDDFSEYFYLKRI